MLFPIIECEILCTFENDYKAGDQLDVLSVILQGYTIKDPRYDHQLFLDKTEALKNLVKKGLLTKEYRLTKLGELSLRLVDS